MFSLFGIINETLFEFVFGDIEIENAIKNGFVSKNKNLLNDILVLVVDASGYTYSNNSSGNIKSFDTLENPVDS